MADSGDVALTKLQSQEQAKLLDALDRLRKSEFEAEFDVPQLIVCGDQSSGKSSVLEAISRIKFPSKETLCTRMPIELRLRRTQMISFSVHIEMPAWLSEATNFDEFKPSHELTEFHHIPSAIDEAIDHVIKFNKGHSARFYKDRIVITICRPDVPPLTLIDLPGLIRAANKSQTEEDITTMRDIVLSYISHPSSIILAFSAANVNIACQEALELARQVDPKRERTLGIMTKPDLVSAGQGQEEEAMLCVQIRNIVLHMGWHVLKNCGSECWGCSPDDRDRKEA